MGDFFIGYGGLGDAGLSKRFFICFLKISSTEWALFFVAKPLLNARWVENVGCLAIFFLIYLIALQNLQIFILLKIDQTYAATLIIFFYFFAKKYGFYV